MDNTNRRDFLKLAALAASSAASRPLAAWAAPDSPLKAWRTTGQQRYAPIEAPAWRTGETISAMSIRLDPDQHFQQVLGFGAALTDSSCYLLEQLDAAKRKSLLDECFGPSGLRFSVARTTIGSSDYSLNAYSYDDTPSPDPSLTHFSIEHDRKYILPLLKEARQTNPELFYFSSPWSPPGWMKASNSLLGGNMRSHYFDAYAQYFVKFLDGYAADGVKINAVTVQNEVDTDQDGRMPQALWGQEYEMNFVKGYLGPALEKSVPDTKIWILDHNYNLWGRAVDELSDPDVYKYVDGVAWHGYYGPPSAMTRVHDMFPAKNAYWTEGGPDITEPDYATNWAKWSSTFTGILRNWARCIVSWNLVLDEHGEPNIGPFSCGGVVTINSKTQEFTRSGQYWAFAHYSKAIQRGARVIASWGDLKDIDHVAVENPDGSHVLVLTNTGREQSVQCALRDQSMTISLPPDSVTTLAW
ncbi:glycoside hydrolase family 30 protein [Alloacidobacterium sp.]|uniref:glycoside hydrolase family 30 protein n=1 Tax=Alloacidobacterium sp. TaxID=2951999 RepID=UPI002D7240CE|nr:glycoside hydrolase family 30 beta sandwich domain-containing protein [Alloacidobacterium sp.]HYK36760.1 glycoside hydrolase family 30 beta sandwich domain-containing protein [Alloacidobacterium sp.]